MTTPTKVRNRMADTAPRAAPIATEFSPSTIWWLSVPLPPAMESVPELVVGGRWLPMLQLLQSHVGGVGAVGHAVQSGHGVILGQELVQSETDVISGQELGVGSGQGAVIFFAV